MYCIFHRVCWDRHGFGSVSRMNSRTLTLSHVRTGGAMFRPRRGGFSVSLSEAFTGCFLYVFLMFFLSCEKTSCISASIFYGRKIYGHKRMGIWKKSTKGNWWCKSCKKCSGKSMMWEIVVWLWFEIILSWSNNNIHLSSLWIIS